MSENGDCTKRVARKRDETVPDFRVDWRKLRHGLLTEPLLRPKVSIEYVQDFPAHARLAITVFA